MGLWYRPGSREATRSSSQDACTITRAVRCLILCSEPAWPCSEDCQSVILTNAAGGCGDGLEPGDLVLLTDHLNLTGQNPLHGSNDDRLGPRFPDMSTVYPAGLRSRAHEAATAAGTTLKEGVYAWFTGPSYETPAEVEMARRMGADLVGMSTVPEAIAVRHMGGNVIGLSLVTNYAAGIIDQPLSHEEVTETAALARDRFSAVIDHLLRDLVSG